MKKFIIAASIVVLLLFAGNEAYYRYGIFIDLHPKTPVTTFVKTDDHSIMIEKNGQYVPFEIRGVDMGLGIPGQWANDFAIDKETYIRWFGEIQEMGANTIRVYTINDTDFYEAFYEYNEGREEPLYLIHGIWVNDYAANSHRDAYDDELFKTLQDDCRTVVDIIHGQKNLSLGYGMGSGSYRKDVSDWVIGYIIGVEWETGLVTYTNEKSEGRNTYIGEYMFTKHDASPFEAMLCQVGDKMIEYESKRYKHQRLVAFSNWPTTDPFAYSAVVSSYRQKVAYVDVEHIATTVSFEAGMFASYHVYSYYPNYLQIMLEAENYTEEEIEDSLGAVVKRNLEYQTAKQNAPKIEDYLYDSDYYDSYGQINTYLPYLKALNRYHTIPVVISEYGVTTGRGMAQVDQNTGRNQGHMSEQEQGQALIDCYNDIMDAGCAGSCVFTWQDEWFKRTWNTMHAVDLDNTPYWSDYQTNEQYFGLLTFDPGNEKSVCYVDGNVSEWSEEDRVITSGDMELSMKYDEKFLYFLVKKDGLDPDNDTLYIPIDTTPKSGSTYCEDYDVTFERGCDFLMVIHGRDDSRIVVQKRYEALLSTYGEAYYWVDPYIDPPERSEPHFERIYLPLILEGVLPYQDRTEPDGVKYETGQLRYGNANPDVEDFDSLADFITVGDYVEIRVPWQLLNFSNPSEMMIHDDYYENYGIENLHIDQMYAGIGSGESEYRIPMASIPLEGWGKTVTSHERLKKSYYVLKDYWNSLDGQD